VGAIVAVDVNDIVSVNTACFRALSDTVGDDVTRAFISQFNNGDIRSGERPRLTASQIADALERGKTRAAAMSASVGGGHGNFTADRHKRQPMSFEKVTERITETDKVELARRGTAYPAMP
jgi:hypothetical protein